MDHFGIGAAIQSAAQIYFRSARRSGRTVSLVDSLKTGDRVIFMNPTEAERVQRLCKERSVTIDVMVVEPDRLDKLFDRGTPEGRSIFDHTWVEQYYLAAIKRCQEELDHLQTQTSGYGEAHRETRRKAEELARWRF